MKTTVVSMRVRVKEIPLSEVEDTKDYFRDLLDQTMTSHPNLTIQGLKTLPKCVGITKIDHRTLFSGMALRRDAFPPYEHEDLQSILKDRINAFLIDKKLDTGVQDAVKIELHHMKYSESEFSAGREMAVAILRSGPKAAAQIAEATALDPQLTNVLLCLLEEECLVWREETDAMDDIFHLVNAESLAKTEEAVRGTLRAGPKSRDDLFRAVKNSSATKARREWVRKALKDLVGRGEVTQDQTGMYSLI